jgi:hypothetical protein
MSDEHPAPYRWKIRYRPRNEDYPDKPWQAVWAEGLTVYCATKEEAHNYAMRDLLWRKEHARRDGKAQFGGD